MMRWRREATALERTRRERGGMNSNFCEYILMERFFGCEIGHTESQRREGERRCWTHREPEREGERRCPIEDDVE